MDGKKKIILMLSTYNGEKFLNQQLESIYHQETEAEVVVYARDDGSTDNTVKILDKWSKHIDIRLLEGSKNNLGVAQSFLYLMKNVPEADFYGFMDQDDIWDADKITKAINALIGQEQLVPLLWCSNYRTIDKNSNVINKCIQTQKPDFSVVPQLICGSTQGCAMIFNKTALKFVLSRSYGAIIMHDSLVLSNVVLAGKILYDKNPSFSYRLHDKNVVAAEEKSAVSHFTWVMREWFSQKTRHVKSDFGFLMITNHSEYLTDSEKIYLQNLYQCRKSLKSRFLILKHSMTRNQNSRGLRTFKIRVLLGLI